MTTTDYYQVLEIKKKASQEQIKQSYKRLALKHHPDKNQDKQKAKLMFTQISEAYTVLNDPQKRAFYDEYGVADMESLSNNFDFEQFFGASFDDFQNFLNEAMFSNMSFSFEKELFKMDKGSKNSKRNKRTKNSTGLGGMNKMFAQMMGFTDMMFEGPKPKQKANSKAKKQAQQDDEWQTDSQDQNNQNKGDWQDVDEDKQQDLDMPSEMQLMMLPVFIEQSSTTTKKNKKKTMTCKLDQQTFKNDEDLVEHFCQSHMKQFKTWMSNQ